jgi:beta-lactamase superfamily II metal-dependent hydrolase
VLDRYRAVGAQIARTDLDGQIEVVISGGHEIVTRRHTKSTKRTKPF